jgi:hypothetical protein
MMPFQQASRLAFVGIRMQKFRIITGLMYDYVLPATNKNVAT